MRQYTRTVYVKYISLQRNFLLAKYVGMQLLYYRIAAQCENIYSGCFEDRYDAVICVAGKFENIKLYVHTLCNMYNIETWFVHFNIDKSFNILDNLFENINKDKRNILNYKIRNIRET